MEQRKKYTWALVILTLSIGIILVAMANKPNISTSTTISYPNGEKYSNTTITKEQREQFRPIGAVMIAISILAGLGLVFNLGP